MKVEGFPKCCGAKLVSEFPFETLTDTLPLNQKIYLTLGYLMSVNLVSQFQKKYPEYNVQNLFYNELYYSWTTDKKDTLYTRIFEFLRDDYAAGWLSDPRQKIKDYGQTSKNRSDIYWGRGTAIVQAVFNSNQLSVFQTLLLDNDWVCVSAGRNDNSESWLYLFTWSQGYHDLPAEDKLQSLEKKLSDKLLKGVKC